MNYHNIVTLAKTVIFPKGEPYMFRGRKLRFKAGSRPIRRRYIKTGNDVVRNDLLQIEYFERNFTPNDILWDIGSHHGHYTIFTASIVNGSDQVFSFEPDEVARRVQIQNIELNNLSSKARVMDIAIGNKNGSLKFKSKGGNSNSHLVSGDYSASDRDIISVEARTINSLLNDLPAPTFVKIDTEGAEVDILSEATTLLSNPNVKFICELHPFAWEMFNSSFDQFKYLLDQYGRDLRLLDSSKRLEDLPFYGTVLF